MILLVRTKKECQSNTLAMDRANQEFNMLYAHNKGLINDKELRSF